MKILLTNDDGIYAPGLWVLYRHLAAEHRVTVIAPDRERTAVGHGITLNEPLRARQVTVNGGERGLAVSGTPADCIKLGVGAILGADERPDVVVSGINPGANLGVNINYSGTVAAAREAALHALPAVAVSLLGRAGRHYATAARFVAGLLPRMAAQGLPFGTCLNVNVPDKPSNAIAGVQISRQGIAPPAQTFDRRTDPRNGTYYWHGIETPNRFEPGDLDIAAVHNDYISVTPIQCDATDFGMLENLKQWNLATE